MLEERSPKRLTLWTSCRLHYLWGQVVNGIREEEAVNSVERQCVKIIKVFKKREILQEYGIKGKKN